MPALKAPVMSLGANPFGSSSELVTLRRFVAERARKGYDVPFPASPLANRENIGCIWESTFTGAAVVWYPSSGIEVLYGGAGVDYDGIPANQIQTVNGVQAIVFPADRPYSFAQVMLPIPGGHLVTLRSSGRVSDLVEVAQTMPISGPHC